MEINTVIILNMNLLSVVSKHEGFGINTNLFETNILNLVVVIGVLVYYGRSLSLTRDFFVFRRILNIVFDL